MPSAGSRRRAGILVLAMSAALSTAGCLRQDVPGGGPPLLPGMQVCIGVPAQTCQEHVASFRQTGSGAPLSAYRIVCTQQPACTLASGEASVEALYADGSGSSGSFGWASAPAEPAAP